jgi:hypothetical protein
VSSANVASKVVGPMIRACRISAGEKLNGRRRRNVIIDVGRSRTAKAANTRDFDRVLSQQRSEREYALEYFEAELGRDRHGQ